MDMRRNVYMILFCLLTSVMGADCARAQEKASEKNMEVPKVYMFTKISAENLVKIYEALGREATGKVAVKLSTGEPGGHNFLQPALIKDLVKKVNGTIVECNTAYGGGRANTENHLKAAKEHGFTAIAPVDIMDADGEVAGAKNATGDVLRPALQIVKTLPGMSVVSGAFLLLTNKPEYGENGLAVRGILLCRKAEEKAIPLEKREKPPVRNHSEGGFLLFKTRKKRFEEGKRAVSGVFYAYL